MYTLYLDKAEDFVCEIDVKNATTKGSMVRLIVESNDGFSLVFNGKLENNKCIIPIKRLKGILDEGTRGNVFLECIVEDTYFKPWADTFSVEEHTSVKVKVNEQQKSKKPIVEVKSIKHPPSNYMNTSSKKPFILSSKRKEINIYIPLAEISDLCKRFGIKKNNVRQKKNDLFQILKEYFNANREYKNHQKIILNKIGNFLK